MFQILGCRLARQTAGKVVYLDGVCFGANPQRSEKLRCSNKVLFSLKKFYKIFQILRRIEYCDTYIEY